MKVACSYFLFHFSWIPSMEIDYWDDKVRGGVSLTISSSSSSSCSIPRRANHVDICHKVWALVTCDWVWMV